MTNIVKDGILPVRQGPIISYPTFHLQVIGAGEISALRITT